MDQLKIGNVISKKRKELGLTQNQLAGMLDLSFQAISKWENNAAYPDVLTLPKLAAALHTTTDALLGYSSVVTDYDKRYHDEEYYWGLMPNSICYDIMKILPPTKPYRLLDIGCGEGKDAVFFAKCGYSVTAFDLSSRGIEKAKLLARHNQTEVNFFQANLLDYRLDSDYDIIFCSGAMHILPTSERNALCDHLKEHTTENGINALNVFVKKPFISRAPDASDEEEKYPWYSGELFGYYHDWFFHTCREDVFDCDSSGISHKHCMDTLIAQKQNHTI